MLRLSPSFLHAKSKLLITYNINLCMVWLWFKVPVNNLSVTLGGTQCLAQKHLMVEIGVKFRILAFRSHTLTIGCCAYMPICIILGYFKTSNYSTL